MTEVNYLTTQPLNSINIEDVKLYVIPGWINRAIIRNKLNIVDVTDYAKMRSILSLQDFAEWIYINNRFKLQDTFIAPSTLERLFDNMSREQTHELNNSVVPLSETDDIASTIKSKLSVVNSMSEQAYQFIPTGENIYLILNEGFGSITNNSNNLLGFIKDYLKVCYSKYSIQRVSLLGIYHLYVKLV